MANKMLIDATHPEETRVVVVRGSRMEEFDFESADRKPLRGNIYLAKVTRVEPSLQAAFIEYGGNRHGFLAFSEIHPDYYQIPVADREALLADERRAEADEEEAAERAPRKGRRPRNSAKKAKADAAISEEAGQAPEDGAEGGEHHDEAEAAHEAGADNSHGEEADVVDHIGGESIEDVVARPRTSRRHYKIQEVIKRRQILLVQVVKEERGNKGAALTTYLSLAGRYSVLMPNTGRGGGISRKITSSDDRKRLKEIVQELDVPEGMGIILRTAGASRTKPEIKRDYEYLMRMWEKVRELTLQSSAPALVYEEGSLVRRAIRDLYNKDIDEVQVAGDGAYRDAKEFMKLLMPSQAKSVKAYRENQPLFARYGVESQLDAMFSNTVTLKSGGYLVINQTEALVAIDINSGRSTREHNIEDTALKTNLEAAEEIARQLRLRDLAGLIVIDFIDMEERRNNRSVEKKLADCLKSDRARIQLGRISPFGLLEMSRQRIRTGVLESSSIPCPHCGGSGLMRANSSVALQILRALEENLLRSAQNHLSVKTRTPIALYVLNHKRGHLRELELRFGVTITLVVDDSLMGATYYTIEKGEIVSPEARALLTAARASESVRSAFAAEEIESDEAREEADVSEEADAEEAGDEEETAEGAAHASDAGQNGDQGEREGGRRRRRRRRRRGRGGEGRPEGENGERPAHQDEAASPQEGVGAADEGDEDNEPGDGLVSEEGQRERSRRRRGRRGGRRNRNDDMPLAVIVDATPMAETEAAPAAEAAAEVEAEAPKAKPRRGRKPKAEAEAEAVVVAEAEAPAPVAEEAAPKKKPAARGRAKAAKTTETAAKSAETAAEVEAETPAPAPVAAAPAPEPEPEPAPVTPPPEPVHMVLTEPDPTRPKRGGWWRRG